MTGQTPVSRQAALNRNFSSDPYPTGRALAFERSIGGARRPDPPLEISARAGDTLGKIARRYGVSITDLLRANPQFDPESIDSKGCARSARDGVRDADDVRVGDVIIVPQSTHRPASQSSLEAGAGQGFPAREAGTWPAPENAPGASPTGVGDQSGGGLWVRTYDVGEAYVSSDGSPFLAGAAKFTMSAIKRLEKGKDIREGFPRITGIPAYMSSSKALQKAEDFIGKGALSKAYGVGGIFTNALDLYVAAGRGDDRSLATNSLELGRGVIDTYKAFGPASTVAAQKTLLNRISGVTYIAQGMIQMDGAYDDYQSGKIAKSDAAAKIFDGGFSAGLGVAQYTPVSGFAYAATTGIGMVEGSAAMVGSKVDVGQSLYTNGVRYSLTAIELIATPSVGMLLTADPKHIERNADKVDDAMISVGWAVDKVGDALSAAWDWMSGPCVGTEVPVRPDRFEAPADNTRVASALRLDMPTFQPVGPAPEQIVAQKPATMPKPLELRTARSTVVPRDNTRVEPRPLPVQLSGKQKVAVLVQATPVAPINRIPQTTIDNTRVVRVLPLDFQFRRD